jgi:hypothetical protein
MIAAKAKAKAQSSYAKLSARYGTKWAIAIMAAGIAGLPLPIPGSSLITAAPVIAAAELAKLLSRCDEAGCPELTEDEVEKLGAKWIQQLLDEWKMEQNL